MASLQERRDKSGKLISYSIRVHRGRGADGKQLKPYTTTFEVAPTWTEKSARRKAEAFAVRFEMECRAGIIPDNRQTFAAYCEYVIALKEERGAKHSTILRYRELTSRIYPVIGHIRLTELRPDHLNSLYTALSKQGVSKRQARATAKVDIADLLKKRKISRADIARKSGVPVRAVSDGVRGRTVNVSVAQAIAGALKVSADKLFIIDEGSGTLSAKTILEHHRLIHTVLDQAMKEGIIASNPADRVMLPKAEKKEVNYFQPETVTAIRDALELEPIKWRTLTHMLLITGARRGEILGLKWDNVDFERSRIYICNNILYSPERGIYEDTPKTERSKRYISIPSETVQLLRQYQLWQFEERLRLGEYFDYQGFVFSQDSGKPMHPDSVTGWLDKFAKRHNLPHINPHAFRHTMASMLYFNGVDSVSISARLGHAQVSTTANIYAHVMEQADEKNADILADIFLKKA